jgi:hypothetical protein
MMASFTMLIGLCASCADEGTAAAKMAAIAKQVDVMGFMKVVISCY